MILFGASGLGKAHLEAAVGYALIGQSIRVKFTSSTALVQQLQKSREELGLEISHEAICQHIQADRKSDGTLVNRLRRKGKACQYCSKSQAGRGHIKNRVSINERKTRFTVSTHQ